MARRVICISRADGARGEEVGRLVAERLGFAYVDEEIVIEAAAEGGISPADVADEEQRRSALGRVLREIGRGGRSPAGDRLGIAGMAREQGATSDEIKGLIRDAIDATALRGDVVIVSHAASFALGDSPDVLRVLVTAAPEVRVRTLTDTRGLGAASARKAIEAADAARADYLRRFYGIEVERPTHYDIVLNTSSLTTERAAELVVLAAS